MERKELNIKMPVPNKKWGALEKTAIR